MTKKRPDPAALINELSGGSLFFRKPPDGIAQPNDAPVRQPPFPSPHESNVSVYSPVVRSTALPEPSQPVPRPVPRTPVPDGVPPTKRRMRQRQPFDIYEDQYETLKAIAEDERSNGLPGSMSRMVREGIDLYLARRQKKQE